MRHVPKLLCGLPLLFSLPCLAAEEGPSATLIEMRRHMLDPQINSLTFHNMDELFTTFAVPAAGAPSALEEAPAGLDFSYQFDGETLPASAFGARTFTNALLIMRDDKIVHERYYNNTHADSRFLSMSMAKSFTSLLVGMALADGLIGSVDDPIVQYLSELAGGGYEGVSIRQALLMRSGADWNERYDFGKESPMQQLHDAAVVENRIRFVSPALTMGRAHPPGEFFNYSTVETAVLGLLLERVTGKPLAEYMSERWWSRAGMQADGFWIADGAPGEGRALNGMGYNATLRDYARIGQMVLHEGRANGAQIVPAEWITEATRPAAGMEPVAPGATRGYQYQWWTLTDSEAFMARGLQGQYIYVDPATRTVVVKLSYFPPGEQRADAETEAFLRAVSAWTPAPAAVASDAAQPMHPLDALTPAEIRSVAALLREAGHVGEDARFAALTLKEPEKATVRAWRRGQTFARRAFAVVLQEGGAWEADIDLDAGAVTRWSALEGLQPRVLMTELDGSQAALWRDPRWRAAMNPRGLTEDAPQFCAPLAPGPVLPNAYAGKRILYLSCFALDESLGNAFARPIEGLLAIYDVHARAVLDVIDLGAVPLSTDATSLRDTDTPRGRSSARRAAITGSGEATIAMEGSRVRWDNWEFHLRVDQRVGPVLSLLQYRDGDELRDVAYQLAVSEMFVPYMDPAPTWSWRAYMDVGEYGFGLLASTLQPGADCPASARYLDHTLAGEDGQPFTLRNVVCIFERPSGDPLWRHVGDVSNESRPKTELVVRMAPVVGNYDYLIDYVFDQAGDIEVRVGAAGIDAVKGVAARSLSDPTARADTAYGTLVAPGLVAPNHEHHMIFRIDMDVDGGANRAVFDLIDPQRLPRSNPRRSLWTVASHVLPEAGPLAHAGHEGHLRIESTARRNGMGYATSYQLYPGHSAASVLDANDPVQRRALWSAQPVWLSRFAPDQLYASGPYPNANPASVGLREWTEGRQDIEDEDLVLWYDIGFRHVPRAEDWPSMPAVWHSFRLRPFNFFDRNPALDVAPAAQRVP